MRVSAAPPVLPSGWRPGLAETMGPCKSRGVRKDSKDDKDRKDSGIGVRFSLISAEALLSEGATRPILGIALDWNVILSEVKDLGVRTVEILRCAQDDGFGKSTHTLMHD